MQIIRRINARINDVDICYFQSTCVNEKQPLTGATEGKYHSRSRQQFVNKNDLDISHVSGENKKHILQHVRNQLIR